MSHRPLIAVGGCEKIWASVGSPWNGRGPPIFDSTLPRSYTDVLFGGIRTPWAFSISASKKTS
jgi:hypothetical protein